MSTIVSNAVLNRELRKIFSEKGFDMDSETVKTIRARLCKSLGLTEFPTEKKATLNELIKHILNEDEEKDFNPKKRHLKGKAVKVLESEDEEEESNDEVSEEEEEIVEKKEKKRAVRPREETKRKAESLPYNSDVKSLLELGTAMRMGPNLHRGLKSMDNSERIKVLTERLEVAGASWKGKIPSKTDVFKAKQKRQRQDDLDGLDPSVILETTSRRRSRAVANYADEKDEEEAYNEEEEEELQKTKKNSTKEGTDDNDDDDHDFDGESSSENEFDE